MAIVKDGQAPYTTTAALMEVIDAFRHRNPKTPVTAEVLEMLGLAATIAPRTVQALKLLDLLDDEGEPTSAMIGLKEAPQEEFQARLAEVVRAAYAELFAYRDPTSDPPDKIVDAFRMYNPASMRPRMVRLFYGLCEAAGMIESAPAIENAPPGVKPSGTRRRSTAATGNGAASKPTGGKSKGTKPNPPPPSPPTPPPAGLGSLHPALVGLLKLVPPADQPWQSADRYRAFKTAWDAALPACNPIPGNGEGVHEE